MPSIRSCVSSSVSLVGSKAGDLTPGGLRESFALALERAPRPESVFWNTGCKA